MSGPVQPKIKVQGPGARTGSGVCVQGIIDHKNVRGAHVELYGSPATLLML